MVYTRWQNLKKLPSYDVGQVGAVIPLVTTAAAVTTLDIEYHSASHYPKVMSSRSHIYPQQSTPLRHPARTGTDFRGDIARQHDIYEMSRERCWDEGNAFAAAPEILVSLGLTSTRRQSRDDETEVVSASETIPYRSVEAAEFAIVAIHFSSPLHSCLLCRESACSRIVVRCSGRIQG